MNISKAEYPIWAVLLILIFLRPFVSEYAYLYVGPWYISILILFSITYLLLSGKTFLFSPILNLSVFLFIIAVMISVITSGFSPWSLIELYFFIPNLLIFYIVSKLKPERQKQLIRTIIFSASIIAIFAIRQYFIGFKLLLEYIKEINADVYIHDFVNLKRVFSTFISPNIFASYVVMMLFIGAGLLISAPKLEKIIYGLSLLIMATSLILTKSAGGILAFVLTFILFIFYVISYMLPEQGFKKTAIRKFSTSATFLSFIFLIIFIVFIWNRIPQFLNFKNPNNPIIQRSYYWQASINMIKDFPVLGAGWRKFGSLYEFYKSPLANISHYSHNIFLQIMAEMGPLGLLSFLWIIFIFLKTGLRNIKNNDSQQGLKIGLFCAGCVFLIHNLFDLSFYFGQAAYFWWVILGLFSAADYKNI